MRHGWIAAVLAVLLLAGIGGCRGEAEPPDDEAAPAPAPPAVAPPASPTPVASEDLTEETAAVEEAYTAALQARVDGMTDPTRDDPAIARTHTGAALEHWNTIVDSMIPDPSPAPDLGGQLSDAEGWRVTYPSGSKRRVDIEAVRFEDRGGQRVAIVDACVLDDGRRVVVGGPDDGFVLTRGATTSDVTDTMRQVDGDWKLAERHQNDRVEGATECASESAATPPPEDEQQVVIAAREAAMQARRQAMAAPRPSPDHPALGETHTGTALEQVVLDAFIQQASGFAFRSPRNSRSGIDVQSVTFAQGADPAVAHLEVCIVDDAERFSMKTGDVLSKGTRTVQLTEEMHRTHGRWRLAEALANSWSDGVSGCARRSGPATGTGGTHDPQTIIDARRAAERAWFDTVGPPTANPDNPALARTHTGWALRTFSEGAASLRSGDTVYRVGSGSRNHLQVESVTVSETASVAYLHTCMVHDYDVVTNGEVVDSTFETLRVTESMRFQDGAWKLAGRWGFDVENDKAACSRSGGA